MDDVFVQKLGNCIREKDYKIVFVYSWKHRIREVTAIRVFLDMSSVFVTQVYSCVMVTKSELRSAEKPPFSRIGAPAGASPAPLGTKRQISRIGMKAGSRKRRASRIRQELRRHLYS